MTSTVPPAGPAMISGNALASVAALIGDVARANILLALMDGRALTAGELAWHAGVSASTTSGHLAKLADAGLLDVERQGRHRYYRLAGADVARAVEALMAAAAAGPRRHRPCGPRDEAMRLARTCYDHLAGRLGTALTDALVAREHLVIADGLGLVTASGEEFLAGFGIDPSVLAPGRRPACRTCLDWSERRPHLAGRLGSALRHRCLELGWIAPVPHSRAVAITAPGRRGFAAEFGILDGHLAVAAPARG
ncbi:ArsR/SmtB family transcription factor [Arenibaculum pallidiluteum]|uniref:ArsR/SmtB family transcription factor n=1 Tax=Arenibaculum pallidiluteum TaxID=2812559 RepID=UPI001F27930E|nr:winged helix-turn-helix domain-containing protein [Arenibaculum pallidiluteum]